MEHPAPVLSAEQARLIDRIAAEEYGLPTIVLMENAARALAVEAAAEARRTRCTRILICAGTGKNGGDGMAAARHLHNAGLEVRIALLDEPAAPDARVHLGVARRMGIPIGPWASEPELSGGAGTGGLVIIDAILGTGLSKPVAGPASDLIGAINARRGLGAAVVAADVPSGLDANLGIPLGACVRADLTVTFAGVKRGLLVHGAAALVGRVVVGEIGVPREIIARVAQG